MIFLFEYERKTGDPAKVTEFADEFRADAEQARLALEQQALKRGDDLEIVLIEAANQAVVRKTHRRYFDSLKQFINAPAFEIA